MPRMFLYLYLYLSTGRFSGLSGLRARMGRQPRTLTMLPLRDSVGNVLAHGETVIEDLKTKGASSSAKIGTRVRSIRLVNGGY